MKKGCHFLFMLFILTVVTVFSFYRVDSAVAMAADQNMESAVEPEPGAEESAGFDAQPEAEGNSDSEPKPDENVNSDTNPKENTASDAGSNKGAEENTTPDAKPETEENTQPEVESEAEEEIQSDAEPQPETMSIMKSVAAVQTEPVLEPAAAAEPEESISTGSELIAWLESHKNTGGTAKLSDNVVLDGYYSFCPDGINMPAVYVDTDQYTITVTGEIDLLSDDHLIFSGQPDGKSIFYVASKGMLSMEGLTVESGQGGALWQEEGAGLVVSDCSVSGGIHYADTPFVMYYNNHFCAVVENGETINDVLPSQMSCTVCRQGQQLNDEWISVSWDLEGTEKQQEERLRFRLQGSFLNAASAEPAYCTVVYNDYPLTFTEVKAMSTGILYSFRGGFTAPEESLPFTVMPEYSFDGESWFPYEEQTAINTDAAFYIAFKHEQYSRAAQSNIYIRLQWNDNGTVYFSNTLCYSADDLEIAEDIGGSRGGGISIINPPDEPQQSVDTVSAGGEEPGQDTGSDTPSENAGSKEDSAGTKQTENGNGDSGQAETVVGVPYTEYSGVDAERLPDTESPHINEETQSQEEALNTDKDRTLSAGRSNTGEKQALYAESNADDMAGINHNAVVGEKAQEAVAAAVSEGNNEKFSQIGEQTLYTDNRQESRIVIAAGFVLLSTVGGMAGFYVHSRSGTNR